LLDIYLVFFFLFGAIFGSFANVLILRMPAEESLLTPSRCGSCKEPVGWLNNIPILSYFILRGRCARCGAKFSIRYPLVEFIMAFLFALSYYRLGLTWFLPEFLIFVFGSVTAAFIDIDHFILPDEFTLGGLVLALIGAAINPERSFWDAVIGMLVGGGFLYLTAVLYFKYKGIEGMGGGDIKLLGWIGALMGWQSIIYVIMVSCVTGTLYAIGRRITHKKGFNEPIQFGPFIILAALSFVLFDPPTIVQATATLFGLQSG
jgi:leader peptidase (prepilin peptidase)/N-methyltransferase